MRYKCLCDFLIPKLKEDRILIITEFPNKNMNYSSTSSLTKKEMTHNTVLGTQNSFAGF